MPQLIDITDAHGVLVQPEWLEKAAAIHRQLRPHLPADYAAKMQRVFTGGGRMRVAVDNGAVQGVTVWRVVENTADGLFVYIDDLVTDELRRSTGVGRALFRSVEASARELGCEKLTLDSGTQRQRAHTFYFREGMTINSFHFSKALAP